jgi:hypothetical protein
MCLKGSVNGARKQTKQKIQQIKFIGLQNNRHPSHHTVGNVHKAPDLAPDQSSTVGELLSVSPP